MYETPSLTNQTMPIGYNYNQFASMSSSMTTHDYNQNDSLLNLLQLSKETNTNCSSITQISPKCDDAYGFLWDMDLEDHHDGVESSNLEGIRFEVDNNTSSMVLI